MFSLPFKLLNFFQCCSINVLNNLEEIIEKKTYCGTAHHGLDVKKSNVISKSHSQQGQVVSDVVFGKFTFLVLLALAWQQPGHEQFAPQAAAGGEARNL